MLKSTGVQIALDVLIMSLTVAPIVIFKYAVTPQQRGFYCDDESIRYPYKSSTVNNVMLDIICIAFPIAVMIFVEWYRIVRHEPKISEIPTGRVELFNRPLNPIFVRVYYFVGYFLFGVAMNQTLTDIGKYTIGRLRPHFYDVCRPDIGHCIGHEYITDFKCTTKERYELRDSRLSFPSGHSSLSFYAMLFMAIFIEARISWRLGNTLTKPFVQFVLICVAFAISLSRISDYKHHWSDVFAGVMLGSIVSLVTTIGFMKIFRLNRHLGYDSYSRRRRGEKDSTDAHNLQQVTTTR